MRPGWGLLLLTLVILGSWPRLRALVNRVEQSPPQVRVGDLLVARPGVPGPGFARTVVLILAHGPERTQGVVVNRSPDPVAEGAEGGLQWGGPVDGEPPILVAEGRDALEDTEPLGESLHWRAGAGSWPVGALRVRRFDGYAGWAPGQLEAEIASGVWLVRPASPDLVFGLDDLDTWLIALGETPR